MHNLWNKILLCEVPEDTSGHKVSKVDCLNLMSDGSSAKKGGFIVAYQTRQMKLLACDCLSNLIRTLSVFSISVIVIKA